MNIDEGKRTFINPAVYEVLTVENAAAILHAFRYDSRRIAKRVAGELLKSERKHIRAAELDALLAAIQAHPKLAEIEAETMRLHLANAANDRPRRPGT